MHGRIYEITRTPLEKNEWARESYFENDQNMDWVREVVGEEREKDIEHLLQTPWAKEMFERDKQVGALVFKGGLNEIKKKWYKRMLEEVVEMAADGNCDVYCLKKTMLRPFGDYDLFCLSDYTGQESVFSCELLSMLDGMSVGDKLYINAVFDYHW